MVASFPKTKDSRRHELLAPIGILRCVSRARSDDEPSPCKIKELYHVFRNRNENGCLGVEWTEGVGGAKRRKEKAEGGRKKQR